MGSQAMYVSFPMLGSEEMVNLTSDIGNMIDSIQECMHTFT